MLTPVNKQLQNNITLCAFGTDLITNGSGTAQNSYAIQTQQVKADRQIKNPRKGTECKDRSPKALNLLKPTGYVMHQQFNIQQLYVLPTLYLCVLYLSENKQRLVPLTA